MIDSIRYCIKVSRLDFRNTDYNCSNRLVLIPGIIVDVKYKDFIIRDIDVYHTRNGFVVELNIEKLSLDKRKELEYFINRNKEFLEDFNWFMINIINQKCYGGSSF